MAAPVLAEKRCSRCGETKPLTEFYRNRRSSDGRHSWCAACQRSLVARHRERRGPERDRLQRAAYQAATTQLRERHREEFDALYAAERYERGLV